MSIFPRTPNAVLKSDSTTKQELQNLRDLIHDKSKPVDKLVFRIGIHNSIICKRETQNKNIRNT